MPKSINIVSGVPLTIPEYLVQQLGISPQQNTGGWGDVMSNVSMALEIKKKFPQISVRLIVTLNDDDSRKYVNRVRDFIPKVLPNDQGVAYLNPDLKTKQTYQGVDVYFVSLPQNLLFAQEARLSADQIVQVKSAVDHIPKAEMGIQYSANDNPASQLILKNRKIKIFFQEYSEARDSHAYSFFHKGAEGIKLNSGPLSFGVYGFGSHSDGIHSSTNIARVQNWLDSLKTQNSSLADMDLKLSAIDLSFAYAGDALMIEDYNLAVTRLAKKKKDRITVIAYKGKGTVIREGNRILVPLNDHPKELAHALISESTYSPLVTGDGSFSSALETTSRTKSFLYENVPWKAQTMTEVIYEIFAKKLDLMDLAAKLLVPSTRLLESQRLSRTGRVRQIVQSLENVTIHSQINSYFSRRKSSLDIADNTINMFPLLDIFEVLRKNFDRGFGFSEEYIKWLVNLTKSYNVEDGFPEEKIRGQMNDRWYGDSRQLLEKWYAVFTLWELGFLVEDFDVVRMLKETRDFLEQRNTVAKTYFEADLMLVLDHVNGAKKSREALARVIEQSMLGDIDFNYIRTVYNKQALRNFRWSKHSCSNFYSFR